MNKLKLVLAWMMAFLCATQTAMADVVTDPYTWVAGQPITAATQNTRFTTLYNGFTTISNVNIKTGAAIAPTKLDTTLEYPILRAALANCFTAGTTGDTVPRVSLTSDGFIKFGAGGASALDMMLKRTSSTTLAIRNAGDSADRHLTLGDLTSSGTFTGVTVTLTGVLSSLMATGNNTIYTGNTGDANPRLALTSDGGIKLGAGGASAVDLLVKREDANTVAIRNAGDSSYKNLKCDVIDPATAIALADGGTNNGSLSATAGNVPYMDGSKMTTVAAAGGKLIAWAYDGATIEGVNPAFIPGGRLSLTSGSHVADATSAATIYYVPIKKLIYLKRGSNWCAHGLSELSLAVTATSGSVYDVFVYSNSGTPTLEIGPVWSSTTSRATAVVQDSDTGLWIKSGDATRLYVGTFVANGSNTISDNPGLRGLFNAYWRVNRSLVAGSTGNYNYTTATPRAASGSATDAVSRVRFVIGLSEEAVHANSLQIFTSSTLPYVAGGMGYDSTSAFSGNADTTTLAGAGYYGSLRGSYSGVPAVGLHAINLVESSQAVGTTTWYWDIAGTGGGTSKAGIQGYIRM